MPSPERKKIRLEKPLYDQGAYFVTICTKDRKRILSNIVGAIHESPEIKLTLYGEIAVKYIKEAETRFQIKIDQYVVMPDHIHLIVSIPERAIRESPLPYRSLLAKVIGYLKMNISRDIHKSGFSDAIWQRSYYDHAIRNQNDYDEIWQYIENNPIKRKEREAP